MFAVFTEFAVILAAAAVAGALGLYLRQPLIIAFIVIGIVAGPSALSFVSAQSEIDWLAQVGVIVLLLLVGLRRDWLIAMGISLGRCGGQPASQRRAGLDVPGIDLYPEVGRRVGALSVRFGDGIDHALIEILRLHAERWIVSTLPDVESNGTLRRLLRESQFNGELAFVARDNASGMALKHIGAPIMLYTLRDAVSRATDALASLIHERKAT